MKYTQITPDITENYLEELLISRGIENVEQFRNPTKECEIESWHLTNMAHAVTLVYAHLNGKIGLLVDSD